MNITIYIILLVFRFICNTWSPRYLVCQFIPGTPVDIICAESLLVDGRDPLSERVEPLGLEPVGLIDGVDSNFRVKRKLTQVGESLAVWRVEKSVEKVINILD